MQNESGPETIETGKKSISPKDRKVSKVEKQTEPIVPERKTNEGFQHGHFCETIGSTNKFPIIRREKHKNAIVPNCYKGAN
jgi:hypothetical protein